MIVTKHIYVLVQKIIVCDCYIGNWCRGSTNVYDDTLFNFDRILRSRYEGFYFGLNLCNTNYCGCWFLTCDDMIGFEFLYSWRFICVCCMSISFLNKITEIRVFALYHRQNILLVQGCGSELHHNQTNYHVVCHIANVKIVKLYLSGIVIVCKECCYMMEQLNTYILV